MGSTSLLAHALCRFVNRAWPLGSYLWVGDMAPASPWERGWETPALSSNGKSRGGVELGQVGRVERMLM